MREITQYDDYTLEIWRRPRQRNMHLTVRPDGKLRVTCNRRRSRREILAFVEESRGFIERRVRELENTRRRFPRKEWLSGETLLFLGERRPVEVVWTWTDRIKVTPLEHAVEISAPLSCSREIRAKAVREFFRRQARLHLGERVVSLSARMDLYPKALSVRGQTTRWGSCSSRGEVSLNMKLMCAPPGVIDYVIVHELAHIRHMNHGPAFWALVAQFDPKYLEHQAWLREFEPEIAAQFLH